MGKYDIAKTNLKQCFKYWSKYDQAEGEIIKAGLNKLLNKQEKNNDWTGDEELMVFELFEIIGVVDNGGEDET